MKKLLVVLVLIGFSTFAKANIVDKEAQLFLGEIIFKPSLEVQGYKFMGYVQNLAIINNSLDTLIMETVEFEFYEKDKAIHQSSLHGEEIYKEANKFYGYKKEGVIEDYGLASNVQNVLNGATVSSSRVLEPHQALVLGKKLFQMEGQPEKVIVKAKGYNKNLELVTLVYEVNLENIIASN
ncbi:hypothetical protein BH23BAC1_BH23BAC1_26400 [soil metagenome]